MSGNRLNSLAFDVAVGAFLVHFETMSLSISDDGGTAMDNGLPNGWLEGNLSGSGQFVLDSKNLMILNEAARNAGSWQTLEPLDIIAVGGAGHEGVAITASKCKLKLTELLNLDKSSKDKTKHTLDFEVTGSEFVTINGVPVANPIRTAKQIF
jgi:hypothetical protein